MKQKQQKLSGPEGFETYYRSVFGERWNAISSAFGKESDYIQLSFGEEPYFLDAASVCAALCVPVHGKKRLADLCAAPGGKTLVVAGNLEDGAVLRSNERSRDRAARLVKVVQTVLPESISKNIMTSCSDGALWCRREGLSFDSILLDAPCSSERHVRADPNYLSQWSQSRTKTMAVGQWALLSSAWRMLEDKGSLLYATCALSPVENDGIVSRLLSKFKDASLLHKEELRDTFLANLDHFSGILKISGSDENAHKHIGALFDKAEETEYGLRILPDTADGAGPLFFSRITKVL